jgi:hypothetical protein
MALSNSVKESLQEAEQKLRNALSFAARQEKPYVASTISELIFKIDSLINTDKMLDKMEEFINKGGNNPFGGFM